MTGTSSAARSARYAALMAEAIRCMDGWRGEEAIRSLQELVSLEPESSEAWQLLATLLDASGDVLAARQANDRHVSLRRPEPELLRRASESMRTGRAREAEQLLREHLRLCPGDLEALQLRSDLLARVGAVDHALTLLDRCLEVAPRCAAARYRRASLLFQVGSAEHALADVGVLLAHQPGEPRYCNLKAVILSWLGMYGEAIPLYERLLVAYPKNPKFHINHGHALRSAGLRDEAIKAYRRCLELRLECGEGWWGLANLKTYEFTHADIDDMRSGLSNMRVSAEDRVNLHFALGKALEDVRDFAASFEQYRSGCELRRRQGRFKADEYRAEIARIMRIYDAEFIEKRIGSGADASDPIFIVGVPRSGSTLVEQILASHSLVEGTMELPDLPAIARSLRHQALSRGWASCHEQAALLDPAELRQMGEEYLRRTRVHRKSGAPRFVDKLLGNFMHIGLIQLMLPNATIIDVRRHPMACGLSCYKQNFERGHHFSNDLGDIGRYYRGYVEVMAHFDSVMPGRVLTVEYERLVKETQAEVHRILEHCKLPFEESCVRFFENRRAVRTVSSEQVRQPIYRDALEQWREFEPWLEPLKRELGQPFATDQRASGDASGNGGGGGSKS